MRGVNLLAVRQSVVAGCGNVEHEDDIESEEETEIDWMMELCVWVDLDFFGDEFRGGFDLSGGSEALRLWFNPGQVTSFPPEILFLNYYYGFQMRLKK